MENEKIRYASEKYVDEKVDAFSEAIAENGDKIKWYNILNGNSTWVANISGYQQIDFDTGYTVVAPTAPSADPSRTALWGAFGAAETLLNYSMRKFTSPVSFTNSLLNFRALADQNVLSLDEEVHFLSAITDPTKSPVDRYSHFCLSKVVENEETIWTLQILKSNWRNICKLVFNETTNTIVENTSSPPGYGSVDTTLTKADYAADAAAVGAAIGELETAIAEKLDAPKTASVGQIFRASAVDENGKVTAVEAVDMPTGGDGGTGTGADGYSPSAVVEQTDTGATITITDKTGTTTAIITNGTNYTLTETDKTEIAQQAASLIDASLLAIIGSGEVTV